MELIELIRKQEAQVRLSLTDVERAAAVAFFTEREKEIIALDTVNLREKGVVDVAEALDDGGFSVLREDIAAPDGDRAAFLSQAPDTDGAFVRVPRAL